MKNKRGKVIVAMILLPVLLLAVTGYFFYTPPLLDGRGYNLPGRLFDFFAFCYYATRLDWLENSGGTKESLRMAARAAWHRPSRIEELLQIKPDDLFQLGRAYAALGLDREAMLLFETAFLAALPDEEKALEIISYLAILGDWPVTARTAETFLEKYYASAEGEYWLGRALLEMDQMEKASEHLQSAFRLQPELIDAIFQMGRVEEKRRENANACSLYEQVVDRAPGHLGAWEGLVRLYGNGPQKQRMESARAKIAALRPPVSVEKKFGNDFILRGYGLPDETVGSGGLLELDIYLSAWRPRGLRLDPEITLSTVARSDRFRLRGEQIEIDSPGDIVQRRLVFRLPPVLYPGSLDWRIAFPLPSLMWGGEEETANGIYLALPTISLEPGWAAAAEQREGVKRHFGESAYAVGKRTFLGPGTEIRLDFPGGQEAGGVGLISYLHRGPSIPQGTAVGSISVTTEEGVDRVYPVIAGRDTAEVWWEFAPNWRRKHKQAPIFRSWPVNSREKQFKACEYYAILSFPRTFIVKALTFKNCLGKSGWHISNIILLPSKE